MDPLTTGALGLALMFALILVRVPIGIAMGMAGFIGYAILGGVKPSLSILVSEPAGIIANYEFAVIPLFLLMGSFATAGGLSAEIYRLAHAFVGHRRGGLAIATMGGCALFGAVCGSS
ncbi:MAG TPA: TRAP transporter large permease, partial [Tistrella mobilis]|nr:TRAP transporter large permease [Tistrella mobilis]